MDENILKFSMYCTLLLIDDDNHSKIFISEKNKYHIKYGENRLMYLNILNSFKDIRKSYEINVIDLTDNYYKIEIPDIKKYCTILLIDDTYTGKILISEKNNYYTKYDDDDDESVYYKILDYFNRFVSVKNNIVNLINNDKRKHDITLLIDDIRIFICEKRW